MRFLLKSVKIEKKSVKHKLLQNITEYLINLMLYDIFSSYFNNFMKMSIF